jgi:hypothetical protein
MPSLGGLLIASDAIFLLCCENNKRLGTLLDRHNNASIYFCVVNTTFYLTVL